MYVFHIYLASCITAIQHSQSMRKTDKQGEVRKRRNSSRLPTGLGTPLGLHGVTQIAADTAQHTRTRKSVQAEIRTRHFWSPCWCVKAQVLAGGCQGPLWAGPLCSPCSQQAWASSWQEQRPVEGPGCSSLSSGTEAGGRAHTKAGKRWGCRNSRDWLLWADHSPQPMALVIQNEEGTGNFYQSREEGAELLFSFQTGLTWHWIFMALNSFLMPFLLLWLEYRPEYSGNEWWRRSTWFQRLQGVLGDNGHAWKEVSNQEKSRLFFSPKEMCIFSQIATNLWCQYKNT